MEPRPIHLRSREGNGKGRVQRGKRERVSCSGFPTLVAVDVWSDRGGVCPVSRLGEVGNGELNEVYPVKCRARYGVDQWTPKWTPNGLKRVPLG